MVVTWFRRFERIVTLLPPNLHPYLHFVMLH